MRKNELLEVTFKLALLIIAYSEELEKAGKYVIARQIMRSGTSIGANSREAQGAESRPDFIHKLKIAYKEAQETEYWYYCASSPKHIQTRMRTWFPI
ncbi:four helix bundle protein [Maribacter flavus]|uniref:four helix bundle protein n=1 Tax=Maribacter flavus TaxID=1658664 RepID=UPI0029395382|nr:four helix bundle protein [Maribacter flavus]